MSLAFHEKYRPKTLDRVIGHENVVTRLKGILSSGNLPNALLFVGPSSSGKTTLARAFTGDLFERSLDSHPDFHEINAADTRGIDDLRELLRVSKLKPRLAKKRVIMVDEAQGLTGASAELLLKPLERPSPNTVWILGSMEPERLKQALKNRCSQFVLKPPERSDIIKYLKRISKAESMDYVDDEVLKALADNANGEMRSAANVIESLQQYVAGKGNKKVKAEDIEAALSSTESNDDQLAVRILVAVYAQKFGVVQRALLDVQDGFRMIMTLVRLNTFLLNQQALKGDQHKAVWWSQQNKDLKSGVDEYCKIDSKSRLSAYATVQQHIVDLRFRSSAFLVTEQALMSDALFKAIQSLKTFKE